MKNLTDVDIEHIILMVKQSGRLLQEVASYFEDLKNSDNLNSFCKKWDTQASLTHCV